MRKRANTAVGEFCTVPLIPTLQPTQHRRSVDSFDESSGRQERALSSDGCMSACPRHIEGRLVVQCVLRSAPSPRRRNQRLAKIGGPSVNLLRNTQRKIQQGQNGETNRQRYSDQRPLEKHGHQERNSGMIDFATSCDLVPPWWMSRANRVQISQQHGRHLHNLMYPMSKDFGPGGTIHGKLHTTNPSGRTADRHSCGGFGKG